MVKVWDKTHFSFKRANPLYHSNDLKIIRSKVWPHVWVGTITCCESPKVSRSQNFLAS